MSHVPTIQGLHHVTAVTADARRNLDFYTRVLGMRLVKTTVNQDDVSAYHLFYADAEGSPGTELTFFEWKHVPAGRIGAGTVSETALRISGGVASLERWREHLVRHGAAPGEVETLSGTGLPSVAFHDPEGQPLRLIAEEPAADAKPWAGSPLPPEASVFGLSAVTLTVRHPAETARFLTDVLGFRPHPEDASLFEVGNGGQGTQLRLAASDVPGLQGAGGVHHVAWMVEDRAAQRSWSEHLAGHGVPNSGLVDRFYFQSVYFRVPGGILFELATRGPGFTADGESMEHLGERLSLPPFLEKDRAQIERGLHPLDLPAAVEASKSIAP